MFPVEVWFEVDGNRVTGRMKDLNPVREWPYADVLTSNLKSMNWIRQRKARQYLLDHPSSTYRISLFPDSILEGTITGDKVSFTKTYAGPCEYSFCEGDVEQVTRTLNQLIQYTGRVNAEGTAIVGAYEIPASALTGSKSHPTQTFELRRA